MSNLVGHRIGASQPVDVIPAKPGEHVVTDAELKILEAAKAFRTADIAHDKLMSQDLDLNEDTSAAYARSLENYHANYAALRAAIMAWKPGPL